MRINTNMAALRAHSQLTRISAERQKSILRLSTGRRINSAADDAAGLSISQRMYNQISGLKVASRNAQDAVSLVQTAEGALSETHLILNRIRDLVDQASNDTYTLEDRKLIQIEVAELLEEIQRISGATAFNTKPLLQGAPTEGTLYERGKTTLTIGQLTDVGAVDKMAEELDITFTTETDQQKKEIVVLEFNKLFSTDLTLTEANYEKIENAINAYNGENPATTLTLADYATKEENATIFTVNSFTFQIGPNAGDTISLTIQDMGIQALGIKNLDVATERITGQPDPFGEMLDAVDRAIQKVSHQRTHLGAFENRLGHIISHNEIMELNLTEAHSRIVDVDMAEEIMNFTKQNILAQATMAMLAQANQMPDGIIQLLQSL